MELLRTCRNIASAGRSLIVELWLESDMVSLLDHNECDWWSVIRSDRDTSGAKRRHLMVPNLNENIEMNKYYLHGYK